MAIISATIWLFITAISPLPVFACRQWENHYAVLDDMHTLPSAPIIVILGAGHTNDSALPPNNRLGERTLGRLIEGIRLYQQLPDSKLVGSGKGRPGQPSQADVVMQTALLLGVSPKDTLQNPQPGYTFEEALACANRFPDSTSLILVTDALHMPRAMAWFRRAGLEPIPAPTNHRVKRDPDRPLYNFRPSIGKLSMTAALLHEWAGMGWVKRRGSEKERE